MYQHPTTLVNLTGGLGNQLFLLAAGLARNDSGDILLVSDYGAPKLSIEGQPELSRFELPPRVSTTQKCERSWLVKKAIGYSLRISLYPTPLETWFGVSKISRSATSILLSLSNRRPIRVTTCEILREPNARIGSEFLVGYFQEYMDAARANVFRELMQLRPKNEPPNFGRIIKDSSGRTKIVVHVRLGDYRTEESFGILSKGYYYRAIESHFVKNSFDEIWIFSDEPDFCMEYIPEKYHHLARIIDYFQEDSALTLEMMRHGDAFVIANSTFSWWGAFLAYNRNAQVTFPSPWFKSRNFSANLIPPNWVPVKQ
jgi:hypothetical protein